MKKLKASYLIVVLAMMFMSSCEFSVGDDEEKAVEFSCKLNGEVFDGSSNAGYYPSTGEGYILKSVINDTLFLLITFPELKTGVWDKETNEDEVVMSFYITTDDKMSIYSSDTGELTDYSFTIDAIDEETSMIEGAFSGNFGEIFLIVTEKNDYLDVTDGVFAVKSI